MIRIIWCAYERVKNVSFSENFALVRKLDDPLFKITISCRWNKSEKCM